MKYTFFLKVMMCMRAVLGLFSPSKCQLLGIIEGRRLLLDIGIKNREGDDASLIE